MTHDMNAPALDDARVSYAMAVAESIAAQLHVEETWDAYRAAAAEMRRAGRAYAEAVRQAKAVDATERAARTAYENATTTTITEGEATHDCAI